jgi:phosphatidylinositol alpha-1,6-mannosyltransferase
MAHGAEIWLPSWHPLKFLRNSVFQEADAVITGSQFTASWLSRLGLTPKNLQTIPYPFHAKNEEINRVTLGSPTNPLRILCLHRLVARKGTEFLLNALKCWTATAKTTQRWTLTLAGDGPERKKLETLAREFGNQIKFLGHVSESEKSRLWESHDLFLLPSLAPDDDPINVEGLGLVLLEAQAAGLPVCASRTGGIPEAMKEGQTGWHFSPGNEIDLCRVLEEIFQNPHELNLRGQAASQWVREVFSEEKCLSSWKALLNRLA